MKKSKIFLLITGMIAIFSANVSVHAQGAGEIILYADANYGGQSVTVTVGAYPDISALGFPNNTASSIKVGSGVVAILHSCVDFGGSFSNGFRAYEANDADFSNDGWPQGQFCGGTTVNNNVDALWVMNKNCVPGPDEVSFYDHPNYQGGCVTVPAGSYESPILAGMPNDWAGSLKAGSNVSVKIWVNSFQGSNFSYGPGSSISNLGFGNNNLSSLLVDGCPNDPNKIEPGACGCGAPETDTDGDNMPDCVDPDDDNDGITDLDETDCGSNPLNAASTCEICDGLDNDLDETVDEGFVNTDGDEMADCIDPDDDNDGCLDENDSNPLVASGDSDCDGVADDCDHCPGGDDSGPCDANAFPGFNAIPESWVCGNNGNKVLLCHNGNTICISPNAVQGHLNNHEDDFLGPCASCAGERDAKPSVAQQLSVEVFPNPAIQEAYIQLKGLDNSEATLTISDKLGRLVVTRQLDAQTQDLITIRLNDFAPGEYFVRVTTDKEAVTKILTVMK